MRMKAQRSGLAEDAQAARDLEAMCQRFEKKIHDLELTRMVSIQTAPQIRLVQNNDTIMAEKIQSTIVNTIPLWKSQMVLALGVAHSADAVRAQREVTDMTNELLRKNAQTLKDGNHRNRQGIGARRGGHRNPRGNQRVAHLHPGRGDEDSAGGQTKAQRMQKPSWDASKNSSSKSCWKSEANLFA